MKSHKYCPSAYYYRDKDTSTRFLWVCPEHGVYWYEELKEVKNEYFKGKTEKLTPRLEAVKYEPSNTGEKSFEI